MKYFYSSAVFLSYFVNWPHFSATSFRLYQSRKNRKQFPLTAYFLPFFMIFLVALSLGQPLVFAPYFIKFFMIWSPYHFSGQTVGITLIYCRRWGIFIDKGTRMLLSFVIYGTFLISTLKFETVMTSADYYGIRYPSFGVDPVLLTALEPMLVGAAVLLLLRMGQKMWQVKRLALFCLLPAFTQFVWFVLGNTNSRYNTFVPFFHSLQYMLLAWAMQMHQRKAHEPKVASTLSYFGRQSMLWYGVNVFGGAMLFYGLPWLLAELFSLDFFMTTGIFIAGVQVHHFFVDGVIWKLRDKTVTAALGKNTKELFVHV